MKVCWFVRLALALTLAGSCLRVQAQSSVVVHTGKLFDGRSDQLLSDQVIVIRGDRVADVGPAGSVKPPAGEPPAGAKEIDLGQGTALPGLIDSHTHILWVVSRERWEQGGAKKSF